MLQGVPQPMRALIEETQPYRTLPDGPQFDALERLRTLSNIDKHRTLATVVSAIQMEYVGVGEGVTIAWDEYATNKPLGDGKTYISSFTATSETEIKEMDVNPGFTYQVRIEEMPLDILVGIARRVFETITACETGQLPHPFALYPI
jgi:hypothetical protein